MTRERKRAGAYGRWIGAVLFLSFGLSGSAGATSILVNGSFEQGTTIAPAVFKYLPAGNTGVTGWTITGDSIDYIGSLWQASDGTRSLDLSGNAAGGVKQTFATVVGTSYTVAFDLAGNVTQAPSIKSVRASAGSVTQDFTFDITGHTLGNMGWTTHSFSFTATSTTTTLAFSSLNGTSASGPALDNVSVNPTSPIPEPSTALLIGAGFLALAGAKRRTRAQG